jgi:hypothetical protein
MQTLVRRAETVFDQYTDTIETESFTWRETAAEVKKHAYVYAGRFDGEYPHEIPLPEHWSEEISKAYGDGSFQGPNDGKLDGAELSEGEQAALDAVAEWERDQRPLDWEHQGANHKSIPLPRAWEELQRLHSRGLLELTYDSSNKPNEYRLTESGWEQASDAEPDAPVLADEV